jgi:dTDP-4-dehydrorhamnose reductase
VKILVTGAKGQLGYDVCKLLGDKAIGVDIEDIDITNESAVSAYIEKLRPCAIIHCAAYTAVDKAESEPELCHAVNVLGTKYLAEAAKKIDAKFMYVSTDYVFDGELGCPYETDDVTNPLGVYGKSKLAGENIVSEILQKFFIVRTSWVFGENGANFVKTMLRMGREKGSVRVISDQIGSPTYTVDLANLLTKMIYSDKYGTYHATNEGFCSWYDFACEVFKAAGISVEVIPITTSEYPTVAVRPKNSRLSKQGLVNAGFKLLPHFKDAIKRYIAGI